MSTDDQLVQSVDDEKPENCDRMNNSAKTELDDSPLMDVHSSVVVNHRSTFATDFLVSRDSEFPKSALPSIHSLPDLQANFSSNRAASETEFSSYENLNSRSLADSAASVISKSTLDELLAGSKPRDSFTSAPGRVTKHFEPRHSRSSRSSALIEGSAHLSSNLPVNFTSSLVSSVAAKRVPQVRVPSYVPAHVTAPFKTSAQVYARPRRGEASGRLARISAEGVTAAQRNGGEKMKEKIVTNVTAEAVGVLEAKPIAESRKKGGSGDYQSTLAARAVVRAPKKKVAFSEGISTQPDSDNFCGDTVCLDASPLTFDLSSVRDINDNNSGESMIGVASARIPGSRVAWSENSAKNSLYLSLPDGARSDAANKAVTLKKTLNEGDVTEDADDECFLLTQRG